MSKRTSQIVRIGQLKVAKLKIKAVKNDCLQEYATIINRGTVAQPMSGWVLASLRRQTFYPFPDDLIFEPGMIVKVQSGQQEPKNTNNAGVSGKICCGQLTRFGTTTAILQFCLTLMAWRLIAIIIRTSA